MCTCTTQTLNSAIRHDKVVATEPMQHMCCACEPTLDQSTPRGAISHHFIPRSKVRAFALSRPSNAAREGCALDELGGESGPPLTSLLREREPTPGEKCEGEGLLLASQTPRSQGARSTSRIPRKERPREGKPKRGVAVGFPYPQSPERLGPSEPPTYPGRTRDDRVVSDAYDR